MFFVGLALSTASCLVPLLFLVTRKQNGHTSGIALSFALLIAGSILMFIYLPRPKQPVLSPAAIPMERLRMEYADLDGDGKVETVLNFGHSERVGKNTRFVADERYQLVRENGVLVLKKVK